MLPVVAGSHLPLGPLSLEPSLALLVGSSRWNLMLVRANRQDPQWNIHTSGSGPQDPWMKGNDSMEKFRDGVPVRRLRGHWSGPMQFPLAQRDFPNRTTAGTTTESPPPTPTGSVFGTKPPNRSSPVHLQRISSPLGAR